MDISDLSDLNDEEFGGRFYKEELQESQSKRY